MRALATLAVTVLLSLPVGRALAADELSGILDGHEKQVARAREVFEQAVQRATEQTVTRLVRVADAAGKRGDDALAARAYRKVLELDRENAEARAYFKDKGNLDSLLTELTKLWTPAVVIERPEQERQVYYEAVLGLYNDGKSSAVTLVSPDGTNVFGDALNQRAGQATRNPADAQLLIYAGSGHIVIPRDGTYELSGQMEQVKIDGEPVGALKTDTPLVLPLKQGWHKIEVKANKNYHNGSIAIRDPRNGRRVPILNSLADIKQFLVPATELEQRVDISRWSPQRARAVNVRDLEN